MTSHQVPVPDNHDVTDVPDCHDVSDGDCHSDVMGDMFSDGITCHIITSIVTSCHITCHIRYDVSSVTIVYKAQLAPFSSARQLS